MEKASFGDGWEGRVVEGRFPLLERLGGTENCASYLTVMQGMHEAVIRLISTNSTEAEAATIQWQFAMSLSHPQVERILAEGRCVIGGNALVYVVSERSSTNLAKTVENGALTADRAREIFGPIVNALSYLHSNGVLHGHLKPSSIHFAGTNPRLAITDLLIASSGKRRISAPDNYDAPELWQGEASEAADTWSLGMTIWEAMTKAPPSWDLWHEEEPEVPASVPSPFREIVRGCLHLDPLRRCTLQSIQERLDASEVVPLAEGSTPAQIDEPVIEELLVDTPLLATDPIAASEAPIVDQPRVRFSAIEEAESEAPSEAPDLSRTLAHFEDAHLPRSRVMPYAAVLLAVIAIGAFLFVREHKAVASPVTTESSAATSGAGSQKQAPAPAPPNPAQTEPVQTEPAHTEPAQTEAATTASGPQEQDKDVPQAQPAGDQTTQPKASPPPETQSAAAVTPPVVPPPAAVDHERNQLNAKGLVAQRVLPTVSPGAREGMRRPVEVLIRVSVNQKGTVSDAAYVEPGPGNYFARLAQRSALAWKFKPPVQNGDPERSVWMLKFNFARASTEATATEQEE